MLTAFSTASSSASLPSAIKVAEENLRLPSHVARFVLTAGSAMNQNGTALFEGVTVLFLAQVYGIELDLVRQIVIVLICVLGGLGNMVGAFVASFIMSEVIAVGGVVMSTEMGYVIAFVIFIVMMFVRPGGILAKRQ